MLCPGMATQLLQLDGACGYCRFFGIDTLIRLLSRLTDVLAGASYFKVSPMHYCGKTIFGLDLRKNSGSYLAAYF